MDNELDQLKKRVTELERSNNLEALGNLQDAMFTKKTTVTDADVTNTYSVTGGAGGTVDALDFPDEWIFMRYKGRVYRVPMYLINR